MMPATRRPGDGGGGGHQDRDNATSCRINCRVQRPHAGTDTRIGRVDQYDGGIHGDTRQGNHTVERPQAERVTGQQQSENHARERHGYGGQDQEGLEIAAELGGDNQVNQAQAKQEQAQHRVQAFLDVIQFTRLVNIRVGEARLDLLPFLRQHTVDGDRVGDIGIDVAFHGD